MMKLTDIETHQIMSIEKANELAGTLNAMAEEEGEDEDVEYRVIPNPQNEARAIIGVYENTEFVFYL